MFLEVLLQEINVDVKSNDPGITSPYIGVRLMNNVNINHHHVLTAKTSRKTPALFHPHF